MATFMEEVMKRVEAKRKEKRRSFLKGLEVRTPRPKNWVSRPKKYIVGKTVAL